MEFVNGFRITSHIWIMENNPVMFETTNQPWYAMICHDGHLWHSEATGYSIFRHPPRFFCTRIAPRIEPKHSTLGAQLRMMLLIAISKGGHAMKNWRNFIRLMVNNSHWHPFISTWLVINISIFKHVCLAQGKISGVLPWLWGKNQSSSELKACHLKPQIWVINL